MPEIAGLIAPGGDIGSMNASIFADSHVLGYIIIALLAFALGVSVTIFCYYLKRLNQQADDFEDKPYTDQEDDL